MRTIENLRDDIVDLLKKDGNIHAAWLTGSYGRGDQDTLSDMDIVAYVGEHKTAPVFVNVQKIIAEIPSVIFIKTIEKNHVINVIDCDWNRIDISFAGENDLDGFAKDNIFMVFDKTDMTDRIPATSSDHSVRPEDIMATTQEFLRVLGLLPVVIGRQDYVTAATGGQLLKNEVVKLFRIQNGTLLHGALSLKKSILPDQYALLESCPTLEHTKKSVIDYHLYMADIFLPLARQMYDQHHLKWPEEFAQAALGRLDGIAK